jgi:uroporphyrinogen-III synthase
VSTLHEELTASPVSACKLCQFLRTLPLYQQAEWQREMQLPVREVGNEAIVRALTKRGVDLSEVSVRRHRKRHLPRPS